MRSSGGVIDTAAKSQLDSICELKPSMQMSTFQEVPKQPDFTEGHRSSESMEVGCGVLKLPER